jgi:NSS family neurotransmitter:Na+ symporter
MQTKNTRDGFASTFGVVVAVAGSAVGLGNLWRFPYMVGQYGGAAFIIIYLLFVTVLCLPIMFSEFLIGRRTQSNVIGAFKKLAPGTKWSMIGVLGVSAAFLILSFYSVVGGWTLDYIFKSIAGTFNGKTTEELNDLFTGLMASPVIPAAWHLVFMFLTALIVVGGVKKGIERYSKILMPILFLMVVILAVRSITLDTQCEGLKFLFNPDFSKITADAILSALGQAFFSLSLGMGCMITYGSYIKKSTNLMNISFKGMTADLLFAILAGLAIMPAVFAFGIEPGSGPGLVFITLPKIFMQIPLGTFFAIIFFVILAVAALTSAISLLEVVVAYFVEELKMSRRKAVIIAASCVAFLGLLCSLSQGVLSNYTIAGKNFFDLTEYIANNILLPVGGLLIVLFVGWYMKRSDVYDELSNGGTIRMRIFDALMILIKFIVPIAIALILLYSMGFIGS